MGTDPLWWEWVATEGLKDSESKVVGWDFTQYAHATQQARKDFFEKKGAQVKSVDNLVDLVWGADRPPRPLD